jgi:predicted SAM-dependent methyltransferase
MSKTLRLNLGCGPRPIPGYINIDVDDADEIQKRYPETAVPKDIEIRNEDILHLPYQDGTVDEVRADSLVEHLSFSEEREFFYEMKRVLRPGGLLKFSTPDFEDAVKLWLNAKDEWKDFYRNDPEAIARAHWFGQYSYGTDNRWGYLMAMLFGNQNGKGQSHRNAYTVSKIKAMLTHLNFEERCISHFRWKGNRDLMILVEAVKGSN